MIVCSLTAYSLNKKNSCCFRFCQVLNFLTTDLCIFLFYFVIIRKRKMSVDFKVSNEEDAVWLQKYFETKDSKYFGKLYEKYKQQIFFRCRNLVQNMEEAKDMASETFIKAYENMDKFKKNSPVLPWLYRIATNLCIDHLRKLSRVKYQELNEQQIILENNEQNNPENSHELKNKILTAMKKLKQEQKRCFSLFYIHNLSYKEIVDITGYSPDHVRSYIQNSRRKVKLLLEQL